MLKMILSFTLLPTLAFAGGPFEINYGTYKVISRRAKESIEHGDMSKGIAYLEIFEKSDKRGRAIVLKRMDADRELRGGGPLLTTPEITGDQSLRCVEAEHIINCTSKTGWFTTVMIPLSDDRYVMSEFNGGAIFPEVIWELEREY
jgi:hypothetical protein